MFDHIIQRMREKVRALDYVMTIHAEEAADEPLVVAKLALSGKLVIITVYCVE